MPNSYQLLSTLLPYLQQYESEHPDTVDPAHFGRWISGAGMPLQKPEPEGKPGEDIFTRISKYLFYLVRYAKQYAKKALEGSPLHTIDEFVYLVTLQFSGTYTKSEIIQLNRHEKPTGMEIIRRLTAAGLVTQFDDTGDRRSKRLAITEAGRETVFFVYQRMQAVGKVVTGNLNEAEMHDLVRLLEKLELFHQEMLYKGRGMAFDEMVSLYDSMLKNEPAQK